MNRCGCGFAEARGQHWGLPQLLSISVFETGSGIELGAVDSARVASHQAPETLLHLPPSCWESWYEWPRLAFLHRCWTPELVVVWQDFVAPVPEVFIFFKRAGGRGLHGHGTLVVSAFETLGLSPSASRKGKKGKRREEVWERKEGGKERR